MRRTFSLLTLFSGLVSAVLLPGCGPSGDDDASPAATPVASPTPEVTPNPATSPTPSGATPTPASGDDDGTAAEPPSPTPEPSPVPPSSPTPAIDADGDGFLPAQDCDDHDPDVHPGAPELCNGRDDDCDGELDEAGAPAWYRDRDGDGFGSAADGDTACTSAPGYVSQRGDCDDQVAAIHPGADDPTGDGIDQDCGGADGPQPHLGFPNSPYTSLQQAVDDAPAGATLWVAPGHYLLHDLDLHGKALTLASTGLELRTVLDAQQLGRIARFATGETAATRFDGFTLTGGDITDTLGGGALLIDGTAPTLANLYLARNHVHQGTIQVCLPGCGPAPTGGDGGGLYVHGSSPLIHDCTFSFNEADGQAGGVMLSGGGAQLTACSIYGNHTPFVAGGLEAANATARLDRCTISGNSVGVGDLSVWVAGSSWATFGGGVVASGGAPVFHGCRILGNSGHDGGGVNTYASNATFANCLIAGNRGYIGGGIYLVQGTPVIEDSTVVDNVAPLGGGVFVTSYTNATISGSILALNTGMNLMLDQFSAVVDLTYSDLYAATGQPNHNLPSPDSSVLFVDPGFIQLRQDLDSDDDDLHLRPDSVMIDSGDPARLDPDGSRADLGCYGGPDADFGYYDDADADGLPDGWERRHGLDPTIGDAVLDPDGDGLSNLDELLAGTWPEQADTDGDGSTDGLERESGSDPTDWYSQPGQAYPCPAHAPQDFTSIQAAVNAIRGAGEVVLEPGTWHERVRLDGKSVTLRGRSGSSATMMEGSGGSIISAVGAKLQLEGLTITGGTSQYGGGLYLDACTGGLENLVVTGNTAVQQPGEPTLGVGGGMHVYLSNLSQRHVEVFGNESDFAGGSHLYQSTSTFDQVRIHDNLADAVGGLAVWFGTAELDNLRIDHNTVHPAGYGSCGGGLYAAHTDIALTHFLIDSNQGPIAGAGACMDTVTATLVGGRVVDNVGSGNGGGLYIGGDSTLQNVVLTGNTGADAGLALAAADYVLENVVLAYNRPTNLHAGLATVNATCTDHYNPSGSGDLDISLRGTGNLSVEPGFLSYQDGVPVDWHLAVSSPLINKGSSSLTDADASGSDIGAYGGPDGNRWDLDGDGFPDWYWPGTIEDAPTGVDVTGVDCVDLDASVTGGENCPAP